MVNARGKYLYCIARSSEVPEFAFAGLNGIHGSDELVTPIPVGGLAAFASDADHEVYRLTRATAMAHQLVIEEVMRLVTVLPFSFGTVADSEEEVRELLTRYRAEFLAQLRYLEGRAEHVLNVLWRDADHPFREILAEREEIRRLREALARRPPEETYHDRIRVGRMVQEAFEAKRGAEARHILERLRPLAVEMRARPVLMDQMILNAAFLLQRGGEPQFEEALRGLDREYEDRLRFRLVGPVAPFSFVHLPIAWR